MITYKRATTTDELTQILELQQANLKEHLTVEQQREQGFVTIRHDVSLLTEMNKACAHIIAVDQEKVIGYALSMHPQFAAHIPLLVPMFEKVKGLGITSDFIIMGQICVAKSYRGQGIFRGLYEYMRMALQPDFKLLITEVDTTNERSAKAHEAVGFEILTTHQAHGRWWKLIALDLHSRD